MRARRKLLVRSAVSASSPTRMRPSHTLHYPGCAPPARALSTVKSAESAPPSLAPARLPSTGVLVVRWVTEIINYAAALGGRPCSNSALVKRRWRWAIGHRPTGRNVPGKRVSQPFRSTSSHAVPNWPTRSYPVFGAHPLMGRVSSSAIAVVSVAVRSVMATFASASGTVTVDGSNGVSGVATGDRALGFSRLAVDTPSHGAAVVGHPTLWDSRKAELR